MEQNTALKIIEKKPFDEIEVTSRLLNIIFEMPVKQQLDLLKLLDANGYNGARRHERKNLKNPWIVMIDPEKEPDASFIKDISRCGMFIETKSPFVISELITLKFQVPASRKMFKIVGEVVRRQKNGVGVRFKHQLP
ncbi:MAG: PilZ domain-containing protein [Proteobacteria bacterium]|nr:PilZ domain-containing protein [Pseudomonadota bacterium]MBU1389410.1 PilZ domain-containing protein [Pseudomonadota bacterium]MBU1541230.1 PilZ domain-containing protein [Pseudomonadota bacterium]MBU2481042.1 PilZ domain-containing protein [Pseudomonadota bacterium]